MNNPEALALLMVIALAFAGFVAILWMILPFAVFGIKPLLRDILHEMRCANEMHDEMFSGIKRHGEQNDV